MKRRKNEKNISKIKPPEKEIIEEEITELFILKVIVHTMHFGNLLANLSPNIV